MPNIIGVVGNGEPPDLPPEDDALLLLTGLGLLGLSFIGEIGVGWGCALLLPGRTGLAFTPDNTGL